MADRILFLGWDEAARGLQEHALEKFNDHVGLYGRMQQEGRIESFDAVFLDPTGNGLGGYFEIRGSTEQINALQDDEEFQRLFLEASMCVERLTQIRGYTGEGIARQMALYTDAIATVPQTA